MMWTIVCWPETTKLSHRSQGSNYYHPRLNSNQWSKTKMSGYCQFSEPSSNQTLSDLHDNCEIRDCVIFFHSPSLFIPFYFYLFIFFGRRYLLTSSYFQHSKDFILYIILIIEYIYIYSVRNHPQRKLAMPTACRAAQRRADASAVVALAGWACVPCHLPAGKDAARLRSIPRPQAFLQTNH